MYRVPNPRNEPVLSYAPGTPERAQVTAALDEMAARSIEIPVVVGGERVRSGDLVQVTMPHAHAHKLADLHQARGGDVRRAIERALAAQREWAAMPFHDRAGIFLKAADLLAGPWRARINAACMLGQSKTVYQSEIDAACELIDFFRFNVAFAERLFEEQPLSPPGQWNALDYRPLEGFVLAVTPFNFLSIAVNLPTAPALLGNVVLWKPANTSALGAWHCLELLREAGLPDGVISFLPGDGATQGAAALESEHLAGIHFTGSTKTFRALWRGVSERLDRYRQIPRIVAETGGKDFIVVHPSADMDAVVTAIVRGGFEYQGQKCSAASRIYLPRSAWPALRERVVAELAQVRMGDVRDFGNFMGAVIDQRAFEKIEGYLAVARDTAKVLHGGKADGREGWFVPPTLVEVDDPRHRLMQEEIFGPVVTCWAYDDASFGEVLDLVDTTSPYGLTGAIFARDRAVIGEVSHRLRHAAGNFYVNDKPTGAVVGQQPFGGSRQSGTNDKAGSIFNLQRWVTPRAIKETFDPPRSWRYPFLG